MKKTRLFVTLFIVLALISACAPAGESILTVGEKAYTQADLEAMGTMFVDYTNKDGETTAYEGVLLADVLADAGVVDSGSEVVFVASDGYEASMAMDEVLACANCIVAFDDGSLRTVIPEMSGKLQVKDVVKISVN
jgi:hypothetical protein